MSLGNELLSVPARNELLFSASLRLGNAFLREQGTPLSGGSTVVLVVEDEPLLLWLAMDIVAEAGYQGIEASNADEAIQILESRNDIRIVFTDIEMPGSMDGLKLAMAVRGRWPPIEIIVVSGWTKNSLNDLPARARFFRKPYKPEDIIETLHQLAA